MSTTAQPSIHGAEMPATPWPAMPISPDQVQEGTPDAKGLVVHQTPDRCISSGFWQCNPSKFNWDFTWDEFVHILAGRVTIVSENGHTCTLGPGDVAHFTRGSKTVWHVQEQVRKFFVLRTAEPLE